MPKVQDHTHKLKRHTYPNGTKVYFCILDCTFKVEAAFALGKVVLCNICNEPFPMNEYSIKLAKPHCSACGKMKVQDGDGKAKFINKGRPIQAIADLGKSAISSMKERMSGRVVEMVKDEDI
jgi:hypothetical protein